MTREEAIMILKHQHRWTGEPEKINEVRAENEALYMAIAALKAEPFNQLKLDGMLEDAYEHGYQQARHDFETQPCEDCVSRADTLQSFESYCEKNCQYSKKQRDVMCGACMMGDAIEIVENLPPVTPKQRTGHWFVDERPESDREIICSNCEQCAFKYHKMDFDYRPKYCPNCGAKMEEVSE